VGDEGTFLQGLALAAHWLIRDQADACVVVGAEEMDWIVADAMRHFQRSAVHGDGAGALYLKRTAAGGVVELAGVTDSFPFTKSQTRTVAARKMRAQLDTARTRPHADDAKELLCVGTQNLPRTDGPEAEVWKDWTGFRLAPKASLGEAFSAAAAWQCVLACDALQREEFPAANVSVVGTNQQAIGARFVRADPQTAAA
jgi:3-oxoacyl-(acyl-carrier-protein) synthase